jgi:hypothetical protein
MFTGSPIGTGPPTPSAGSGSWLSSSGGVARARGGFKYFRDGDTSRAAAILHRPNSQKHASFLVGGDLICVQRDMTGGAGCQLHLGVLTDRLTVHIAEAKFRPARQRIALSRADAGRRQAHE